MSAGLMEVFSAGDSGTSQKAPEKQAAPQAGSDGAAAVKDAATDGAVLASKAVSSGAAAAKDVASEGIKAASKAGRCLSRNKSAWTLFFDPSSKFDPNVFLQSGRPHYQCKILILG